MCCLQYKHNEVQYLLKTVDSGGGCGRGKQGGGKERDDIHKKSMSQP